MKTARTVRTVIIKTEAAVVPTNQRPSSCRAIFTARCYTERGYATVCRLSVCLWRSGTVIT